MRPACILAALGLLVHSIQGLSSPIDDLKQVSESYLEAYFDYLEVRTDYDEQINELETLIQKSEQELNRSRKALSDRRTELRQMETELNGLPEQKRQLESQKTAKLEELIKLRQSAIRDGLFTEESKVDLSGLQSKALALNEVIGGLSSQIRDLDGQIQNLRSNRKYRSIKLNYDKALSVVEQTEAKILELEALLPSLQQSIEQIDERIVQLRQNDQSLRDQIRLVESEKLPKSDRMVTQSRSRLSETKTTKKNQIAERNRAQRELAKKNQLILSSEKDIAAKESLINRLKNRMRILRSQIRELGPLVEKRDRIKLQLIPATEQELKKVSQASIQQEKQVAELKLKLTQANRNLNASKNSFQSAKREKTRLEGLLASLKKERKTLLTDIASHEATEAKANGLLEEMSGIVQQVASNNNALDSASKRLKTLQGENSEKPEVLRQKIANKERQIADTNQQIVDNENDLKFARETERKACANPRNKIACEEAQTETRRLSRQLSRQTQTLQKLQATKQDLIERLAESESSAIHQEEIERLQAQIQSLRADNQKLFKQRRKLRIRIDGLTSQILDLPAKRKRLEKVGALLQKSQSDLEAAGRSYRKAQGLLDVAIEDEKTATESLSTKQKELTQSSARAANLRRKQAEMSTNLDRLQRKIDEINLLQEDYFDIENEKLPNAEREVAEKKSTLQTSLDKRDEILKLSEVLDKNIKSLSAKQIQEQKELKQREEDHQNLKNELSRLTAESKALHATLNRNQDKVAKLKTRQSNAAQELSAARSSLPQKRSSLNQAKAERDTYESSEITPLVQQRQSLEQERSNHLKRLGQYQTLKQQVSKTTSELDSLDNLLAWNQNRGPALNRNLAVKADEIEKAQSDVADKKQKYDVDKSSIDRFEQRAERIEQEFRQIERENQRAIEDLRYQ